MSLCQCVQCVEQRALEIIRDQCIQPKLVEQEDFEFEVYEECGSCDSCRRKRGKLLLSQRYTGKVMGGFRLDVLQANDGMAL